jgi:TRAP-type mannitol/chloroaromatic compound transport system permease small subunit
MRRAWTSDEAARNGGLNDLWLIKAVLPLGLALLALAVVIETLRLLRAAR